MIDPALPFAPLPGTVAAPRGLFVKRWGTLLQIPEHGFARTPGEVVFSEGALDALFRASRRGWRIYLIGNEEAVFDGRLSLRLWEDVEAAILDRLASRGVVVGNSYPCVLHPEGVPEQRGDSVYLLPNTGPFYHASHHHGVDLPRSWVVGDATPELVAGWRSGCRLAGVRTGRALGDKTFDVEPEYVGENLRAVVHLLLTGAEAFSS